MPETFYRPGLLFYSPMTAHQEVCRSKHDVLATSGVVIDTIPELLAEFAWFGAEHQYTNAEGGLDVAADIYGHYFDLDSQAEEKGWSDEDKEIVARHLLRQARKNPGGLVQLYSKPKLPAPWPTYDQASVQEIVSVAHAAGLLVEALAYEMENKKRSTLVQKLNELIAEAQEADRAEESLTAA